MTVQVTRSLREAARKPGGVSILARLRAQPRLTSAEQAACLRVLDSSQGKRKLYPELGILRARIGEQALLALAARPEIESIEEAPRSGLAPIIERRRVSQAALEEVSERAAWGLRRLQVPALWADGVRGTGVVVAHLDSGVNEEHEAFQGRIAHRAYVDVSGRLREREVMVDPLGHGTHTAGSICARKLEPMAYGSAPLARLATVTVMEGGDLIARVLRGLEWILDLDDDRIRVLNLSLGFPGFEPAFKGVIERLRARRILPIASVGNDGRRSSRSPGNYRSTFAVGACDHEGGVWRYSSSNHWKSSGRSVPNCVAPGVAIRSARHDRAEGYRLDRGSSMAAAHVSGLAALLFSAYPAAEIEDVEDAMAQSCTLLPKVHASRQGRGLPDAVAARRFLAQRLESRIV